MAFLWLRLNIWSHSWSLLYCIFISNDQRCILNKCDCNNQSLGHIPGCSLHRIDQIRHTKAHCSVVAATGAQAWWTSGDVLAGVTSPDSTDRAVGAGDYRCATAGPRHSRSHCCQVLSSPLSALAMREAGRWNTWLQPLYTCFQNANQTASQSASRQYTLTSVNK